MGTNKLIAIILSLAIVVGFFMPLYNGASDSLWDLVRSASSEDGLKYKILLHYAYVLIPLTAFIVLVMSVTGPGASGLLRALPFIIFVLLTAYFIRHFGGKVSMDWIKEWRMGFYLILVGSLLLIFVGAPRRTA